MNLYDGFTSNESNYNDRDNHYTYRPIKGHLSFVQFKGDYVNNEIQGEVINRFDDHNVIVKTASSLLAAIIVPKNVKQVTSGTESKSDTRYEYSGNTSISTTYPLSGITHLAFGDGALSTYTTPQEKWEYINDPTLGDTDTPFTTSDQEELTKLQHEIYRKKIDYWCFIDKMNDNAIVNYPTDTVRLTTLLDQDITDIDNEFVLEMGLFGGTASDTLESGVMFNYRIFPGWKKIEGTSLLVHWTLQF